MKSRRCARLALSRGASLVAVKELLGHADVKTTMRYAHLSPAHLRETVAKLDGLTAVDVAAVDDAATVS